MYGESLSCSYKSENIITRNGFATIGEIVNDPVAGLSKDDQLRILLILTRNILRFRLMYLDRLWRLNAITDYFKLLQIAQVNVLNRHLVEEIHVRWKFIPLYKLIDIVLAHRHAKSFEFSLHSVFSLVADFFLLFFQCILDPSSRLRCNHKLQPVFGRLLLVTRDDLYLVATPAFVTEWNEFMVHLCADSARTYGAVYCECKIECSGTNRKHLHIALRCVHINLFGEETGLEVLKKIDAVSLASNHLAYLLKPFIEPTFICCAFFVFPVRGKTFLGDLVHALAAYLHFHPFSLRPHHSGVQCFITVRLRIAEPVAKPFGRRSVFICYQGINLPAIFFFF